MNESSKPIVLYIAGVTLISISACISSVQTGILIIGIGLVFLAFLLVVHK